jgi:hypothetical protein
MFHVPLGLLGGDLTGQNILIGGALIVLSLARATMPRSTT